MSLLDIRRGRVLRPNPLMEFWERGLPVCVPNLALADAVATLDEPARMAVLALTLASGEGAEAVVGRIVRATLAVMPVWLPEAEGFERRAAAGIAALRAVAARLAARRDLFGPLLDVLAVAALTGTVPDLSPFHRAIVLRECRKLLVLCHGGADVAVAIEPQGGARVEDVAQQLADAGFFVLLTGRLAATSARLPRLDWAAAAGPPPVPEPAPLTMTPCAGRPNPTSATECRMELFLARQGWAAGRVWNRTFAPGVMEPAVRVDIMWPAERCVVELDGPDHLSAQKFAADRRRDRILQLAGHLVLRFTNDEVAADIERVGAEIARHLGQRRGIDGG